MLFGQCNFSDLYQTSTIILETDIRFMHYITLKSNVKFWAKMGLRAMLFIRLISYASECTRNGHVANAFYRIYSKRQ